MFLWLPFVFGCEKPELSPLHGCLAAVGRSRTIRLAGASASFDRESPTALCAALSRLQALRLPQRRTMRRAPVRIPTAPAAARPRSAPPRRPPDDERLERIKHVYGVYDDAVPSTPPRARSPPKRITGQTDVDDADQKYVGRARRLVRRVVAALHQGEGSPNYGMIFKQLDVCGHGGHLSCMRRWLEANPEGGCPTGCGCPCRHVEAPEVEESEGAGGGEAARSCFGGGGRASGAVSAQTVCSRIPAPYIRDCQ